MRTGSIRWISGFTLTGFTLAILVFCVRAWLVRDWGSPVPFWDQWDAEAINLYLPWLNGTLRWSDLFASHNEHRIVLTRLSDLALLISGGNWNPWWQLMLNAALHATIATVLLSLCWKDISDRLRPVWMAGLALLFIAPAGWQNALWGFQSQVFFCNLLSLLALGGLLPTQPLTPRWWLGWLAALLALFSIGSGIFAAATAFLFSVPVLCAGYFSERKPFSPPSLLTLCALLMLVSLGLVTRVEVPQHEPLHARSLAQFSAVFFRCLGWPWVDSAWVWPVLQAPLIWLAASLFHRRIMPTPMERFALGIGLLTVLHAAAVAYTRGAGLIEARPLSRYQDSLLLGVAANFFLLLKLAAKNRSGRIAMLLWVGVFLPGLLIITTTNLSLHLPFKRMQDVAGLAQIRSYLVTHEASAFPQDSPSTALHPDSAVVRRVLDDPQLRPILPREFTDETARPPWLIEFSPWLTLLSVAGLLLAISQCRRSKAAE